MTEAFRARKQCLSTYHEAAVYRAGRPLRPWSTAVTLAALLTELTPHSRDVVTRRHARPAKVTGGRAGQQRYHPGNTQPSGGKTSRTFAVYNVTDQCALQQTAKWSCQPYQGQRMVNPQIYPCSSRGTVRLRGLAAEVKARKETKGIVPSKESKLLPFFRFFSGTPFPTLQQQKRKH